MFWLLFGVSLVVVFFFVRFILGKIDGGKKRKDAVALEAQLESKIFELETEVAEAIISIESQSKDDNDKGAV